MSTRSRSVPGARLTDLPPDLMADISSRLNARDAATLARVNRAARAAVRQDMQGRMRAIEAEARRLEPMIRDVRGMIPLILDNRQALPAGGQRVPGTGLTVERNDERFAYVKGTYGRYQAIVREFWGTFTFAIYKDGAKIVNIVPDVYVSRRGIRAFLTHDIGPEEKAAFKLALAAVLGAGTVTVVRARPVQPRRERTGRRPGG